MWAWWQDGEGTCLPSSLPRSLLLILTHSEAASLSTLCPWRGCPWLPPRERRSPSWYASMPLDPVRSFHLWKPWIPLP